MASSILSESNSLVEGTRKVPLSISLLYGISPCPLVDFLTPPGYTASQLL